jgi:hypothetical protein
MKKFVTRLVRDDSGVTAIEYSLMPRRFRSWERRGSLRLS